MDRNTAIDKIKTGCSATLHRGVGTGMGTPQLTEA